MHERIYSIRADKDLVEFVTWKVRAIGERAGKNLFREFRREDQATPPVAKARRPVYLHERGAAETIDVFDGEVAGAGARFEGPCLIETPTFTAFIKVEHSVLTDSYGNFLVTVASN
jgi:N-methylhydantoinase A